MPQSSINLSSRDPEFAGCTAEELFARAASLIHPKETMSVSLSGSAIDGVLTTTDYTITALSFTITRNK